MNQEIERTNLKKRQQIIKSLAVGGVAITAWHQPIVNSVILPAHAQTSDGSTTSGQAGEAGQVGQTEQGQTDQPTQATEPVSQQIEPVTIPGEGEDADEVTIFGDNRPDDALLPLEGRPRFIREDDGTVVTYLSRMETDNRCGGSLEIVSYGLVPGSFDRSVPEYKDRDEATAHIKIVGIKKPVQAIRLGRRPALRLSLRDHTWGDSAPLVERIPGNGQPARESGMFTVFFHNWMPDQKRPYSYRELRGMTLRCVNP